MKNYRFRKILAFNLAYIARHLAALSAFALIFSLLIRYIPRNATYEYTESEKSAINTENVLQEKKPAICTLKLDSDTLGIYSAGGQLQYTAKIDPDLLTDYDRELLSEGISATYDELSELICELLS